jgi:hypothetical protein
MYCSQFHVRVYLEFAGLVCHGTAASAVVGLLSYNVKFTYIPPVLLPPYRIIGQLRISRQTLTFDFNQKYIRYII